MAKNLIFSVFNLIVGTLDISFMISKSKVDVFSFSRDNLVQFFKISPQKSSFLQSNIFTARAVLIRNSFQMPFLISILEIE